MTAVQKASFAESELSEQLIGKSADWRKVLSQIELVAPSNATVLITGESGTGKEVVASAIHRASARCEGPLIKVNCAAIAPELFESEFFGHVRGSFTGATRDRPGRFGLADGGTIFLDEIGEVPLSLQGKLLRVLQEGEYERVGEDRPRKVNVRVIAATNLELGAAVESGEFRSDLYYRLSVFPIHISSLRERMDDVPLLAEHFLRKLCWRDRENQPVRLSDENIRALQNYHYPGNVRELENIIERAAILSHCFLYRLTVQQILDAMLLSDQRKKLDSIADGASPDEAPRIMTYGELKEIERENIIQALKVANNKIYGAGGAAEILGVKPTTLASRIKALEIRVRPKD